MNKVLKKIVEIAERGIENYLPEVTTDMLEEKGKLYYMNDIDGTPFDWEMNGRLCEFMSFYDDSKMGAIKINVLSSGVINIYLYENNAKSSFKNYQELITKEEVFELAVLMFKIADMKGLYGSAINDMDSNVELTENDYQEFYKMLPFN